jgi:hypothetical protein
MGWYIDMVIYHIDMVILHIDIACGLVIWEMTVSLWSSPISIRDISSLCPHRYETLCHLSVSDVSHLIARSAEQSQMTV